jgi:large subunit ribosomal protein L18
MADGPNYETHLRRRREGRTNYEKRLEMLKSGEHRAVVRISNKHAQVQFIAYHPDGDETVVSAVSQQLDEFGWDVNTGNLPAAYLTGFLAGKRALADGIETAVPDIGVKDQQYASRYYATLQGLRDAGVTVNVDGSALPADERVQGEHAAAYESDGLDETFEQVRDSIVAEFGDN